MLIQGQNVDKEFLRHLEKVRETRSLEIKHGHIMRLETEVAKYGDTKDPFVYEDPMTVLLEFMRLQNLRLVDMFTSMDEDGSRTLTREEFRKGLKVSKYYYSYYYYYYYCYYYYYYYY